MENPTQVFSCGNCEIFKKHLSWRASANGCFYSLQKGDANCNALPAILEALLVIGGTLDSLNCIQGTYVGHIELLKMIFFGGIFPRIFGNFQNGSFSEYALENIWSDFFKNI